MMWAAFRGSKELPGSSPGFCCATVQCISIFLLVSVYICKLFQIWSRSMLAWGLSIRLSPNPVRSLYISCAAGLEKDRCLPCAEELRWRCRMPHTWNLTQHRVMMHGTNCTAKRLMPKARCGLGGKDSNQSMQPQMSAHPGGNPFYPFSCGQCTCTSMKCVLKIFLFAIVICRNWARTAYLAV